MRLALLPAIVLALTCLRLVWPLVDAGPFYLAQLPYYSPELLDAFKTSFLAGHFYPRWLPELLGGYGSPVFMYMPPGFWFLALPFALLTSTANAIYAALITSLLLGASGAYLLCRQLGRGRFGGTVCAFFFLMAPHVGGDLYHDSQPSDLLGMMLLPWVLFSYARFSVFVRGGGNFFPSAVLLTVSLAALVFCDLATAVWGLFALGFLLLEDLLRGHRRHALLFALPIVLLMAASLSAPYWYYMLPPPAQERALLPLAALPEFFRTNALQLGIALVGAVMGLMRRYSLSALCAATALVFFSCENSAPDWPYLSGIAPWLTPMRLLPALLPLSLVGIALAVEHLRRICLPFAGGLAVMVCVIAFAAAYYGLMPTKNALKKETMLASYFTPRLANVKKLPVRKEELIEVKKGELLTQPATRSDDFTATIRTPAKVTINQLGFSGWRVQVDGHEVAPANVLLDAGGRMTLSLPDKGQKTLHIWYDDKISNTLKLAIVLICTTGMAALYDWSWWRRKKANN